MKSRIYIARDALLVAWMGGTALFFYLRFSITFYRVNEAALRSFLARFFS